MTIFTMLAVFLAITLAFWLVYKYSPEPLRTPLLWFISLALVAWLLQILGFWAYLDEVRV